MCGEVDFFAFHYLDENFPQSQNIYSVQLIY